MLQISCSVRCRFFDVLRDQRDTDAEAPSPSMARVVVPVVRFFDVLRDQRDTDTEAPSPSMARVVVPVVPALLPGGPPASKIARNAGKGYMLSYLGMYNATSYCSHCSQGSRQARLSLS